MPRQARQVAESGVYHVMLRGVNRDVIFLDDDDYEGFLRAMVATKGLSHCHVLAYCLMPNHIHLVLHPTTESLGKVMKRLGVRYANRFNRKYGRTGHVFQDRYKSRPVETDAYLVTLSRYVWNNPVEAKLVVRAEDYPWSSRRLVGFGSPLLDDEVLSDFVDCRTLLETTPGSDARLDPVPEPHSRHRFESRQVEGLLAAVSGAHNAAQFATLPERARLNAIAELRTRSIPYHQIAAAAGMSTSTVRRLHIKRAADPFV